MTEYRYSIDENDYILLRKNFPKKTNPNSNLKSHIFAVNVFLYKLKEGVRWFEIPKEKGNIRVAYWTIRTWKQNGVLDDIINSLIEKPEYGWIKEKFKESICGIKRYIR
jgi:transposase